MNILLLGSGGREHAFAMKISSSPGCGRLFIAPGNAGTMLHGTNVNIPVTDFNRIAAFVIENNIAMVVVGPEEPLVLGIHDFFLSDPKLKSVPVIGPGKEGAKLEGSKDFAKKFMEKYKIPTASYRSFQKNSLSEGLNYLDQHTLPVVLKADGLAAGKGVIICDDREEAKKEFSQMLSGKFGEAGNTVVIEQFLSGIELSVFVLTDGKNYKVLPSAKDYKRIGEGDTGPNTGGMGAVSPVPFADPQFMQKVEKQIIEPTVSGLLGEKITYKGFIFIGLINVKGDPYVIEYNVRMGDPETEAVLPRIKSDFVDLLEGVANQTLGKKSIAVDERTAVTVVLVSGGYPGSYEKGKIISGMENVTESLVFHAGTSSAGEEIQTAGGRVLAITSLGKDIQSASEKSYKSAAKILFDKMYYRKDIGFDLMGKGRS